MSSLRRRGIVVALEVQQEHHRALQWEAPRIYSNTDTMEAASRTIPSRNRWLQDDSAEESMPSDLFSYGLGTTVAAVTAVLLCLCIFCARPKSPSEHQRRIAMIEERERRRQERRAIQARRQARKKAREDPKKRQMAFLNNLVVQRIIDADEDGNLTLGAVVDYATGESADEFDVIETQPQRAEGDSEDSNTCVICLEPFRVGDVVAWSKRASVSDADGGGDGIQDEISDNLTVTSSFSDDSNPKSTPSNDSPKCLHVFHRDCIAEWLLDAKHDECPFCRTVLLPPKSFLQPDKDPVDGGNNHSSHGVSSAAFVIMQGLVSQARRASYSLIQHASHLGQQQQQPDDNKRSSSTKCLGMPDCENAGDRSGSTTPTTIGSPGRLVRSLSFPFSCGDCSDGDEDGNIIHRGLHREEVCTTNCCMKQDPQQRLAMLHPPPTPSTSELRCHAPLDPPSSSQPVNESLHADSRLPPLRLRTQSSSSL